MLMFRNALLVTIAGAVAAMAGSGCGGGTDAVSSVKTESETAPVGETPSASSSVGDGASTSAAANRFRSALQNVPSVRNGFYSPVNIERLRAGHAFVVTGTIDSVGPGAVVNGPTMNLQCEKSEGVPTGGVCPVTLRIQRAVVSVTLETVTPMGALRDPEPRPGPNIIDLSIGSVMGSFDEQNVKAILDQLALSAPIGFRFVALVQPAETGSGNLQLVTPAAWALVDDVGSLRSLAAASDAKAESFPGFTSLDALLVAASAN